MDEDIRTGPKREYRLMILCEKGQLTSFPLKPIMKTLEENHKNSISSNIRRMESSRNYVKMERKSFLLKSKKIFKKENWPTQSRRLMINSLHFLRSVPIRCGEPFFCQRLFGYFQHHSCAIQNYQQKIKPTWSPIYSCLGRTRGLPWPTGQTLPTPAKSNCEESMKWD